MPLFVEYIRQFGRFQRNARLYLISNALSGVTLGIITVLYNLYLIALGYNTAFVGLVLFVGTIGAGAAIFPAGFCIDRLGGKAILIWASVLIGIAGAGQMLFRSSVPLLVSCFIVGIGGAFILVVNAPYLALNSTEQERPHVFSLNIVVTLVTTVIGEMFGGVLPLWFRHIPWLMATLPSWCSWCLASSLQARSYQLALLLAGVIAVPSFLPLFLLSDDRPQWGTQRTRERHPVLSPLQRWQQFRLRFFSVLCERSLWRWLLSPLSILTLIQVCIGFGAGLFLPYFNIYFVQHLGASPALFGFLDALANTLNAISTLLAPWLMLRYGKMFTMIVPRLLSLPLMLLIGLTSYLPLAAFLYPLRQGLMDMSQGILQVFSMEAIPLKSRGIANSSYQAAYQVAWAISASVSGFIIVHAGYAPIFIIAAIFYLIAIGLLWIRFGHGNTIDVQAEECAGSSGAEGSEVAHT
ncbi:MAG TPA: MFS transporter [Dictyobacter sp.]|jgi:MFS family permease|nr:MFS transporter [Dictyobacter sp.]